LNEGGGSPRMRAWASRPPFSPGWWACRGGPRCWFSAVPPWASTWRSSCPC